MNKNKVRRVKKKNNNSGKTENEEHSDGENVSIQPSQDKRTENEIHKPNVKPTYQKESKDKKQKIEEQCLKGPKTGDSTSQKTFEL